MKTLKSTTWFLAIALLILCLGMNCGSKKEEGNVVTVWAHQGQEAEVVAIRAIIDSFNAAHTDLKARLEVIPSGFKHSYEDKVNAAALAGQLPDVLDLDGPFLARYAWSRILRPIDQWVTNEEREDFLPTILDQGTYNDSLYALGAFESSVMLYYDADLFAKEGIKAPAQTEDAWDWNTFEKTARKLNVPGKRVGISFKMDYGPGEWYTYGFTPLLWSAGGSLLSDNLSKCNGYLNSDIAKDVFRKFQGLFKDKVASASPAPEVFEEGKAAMEWNGHWVLNKYSKIKKFKVGVMPLPRAGKKQVTPCGSWCWGITQQCENPGQAAKVLKWIVGTQSGIVPMVKANGAPPSRVFAYTLLPEYEEMPRLLLYQQLQKSSRPRPVIPFYSVLTTEFSKALHDIALGGDVSKALNAAAQAVDLEIGKGRYFPDPAK